MTRKGSFMYSCVPQIGWTNRLRAGKGASGIHINLKFGGPTGYELEMEALDIHINLKLGGPTGYELL